jgi:hypothetical protein
MCILIGKRINLTISFLHSLNRKGRPFQDALETLVPVRYRDGIIRRR